MRVLVAIRDPVVSEMVRYSLQGVRTSVLGTIDPASHADFLSWPTLADVVLVKAGEIASLHARHRSMLKRLHSSIPLLAVVTQDDLSVPTALPARINGLVWAGIEEASLSSRIELAFEGYCALPEHVLRLVSTWRGDLRLQFNPQEWRVFVELGAGRTNREIASLLGCSEARAKTMARHVLARLGAENRTSAGVLAASLMMRQRRDTP